MYLKISTIATFLFGVTILFTLLPGHSSHDQSSDILQQEGIAVIELFTSQGCSSCPAADRLLSELIDKAEVENKAVYGLSFHVDYWNRLGWKDPYSKKAYTQRQYAYARQMRQQGVYTPQMVVNGQAEFVGSDRRKAQNEIAKAQNSGNAHSIEITEFSVKNGKLSFSYLSPTVIQGQWLNIALVERGIATKVTRGENNGRLLKHDNVVRNFLQKDMKTKDEVQIQIPNDMNLKQSSLILYTQEKSTWQIEGATRMSLSGVVAN